MEDGAMIVWDKIIIEMKKANLKIHLIPKRDSYNTLDSFIALGVKIAMQNLWCSSILISEDIQQD